MDDGDGQFVRVGPLLQGVFPQTRAIAVAATGVRLNQQTLGVGIPPTSDVVPPATQGIYCELRRVDPV